MESNKRKKMLHFSPCKALFGGFKRPLNLNTPPLQKQPAVWKAVHSLANPEHPSKKMSSSKIGLYTKIGSRGLPTVERRWARAS